MTTPILMYHGATVPHGFQRWVVRPARFRAQVCGLAEAGYAMLAVRALVAARAAHRMSLSATAREAVLYRFFAISATRSARTMTTFFSLRRMIIRERNTCVNHLEPESWLYHARSRGWALTRRSLIKVYGHAV